jgi:hypothetical protein
MDINKALKELHYQREQIERAIAALERIGAKRRGRPPKWMKALEGHTAQKKKPSKGKEN